MKAKVNSQPIGDRWNRVSFGSHESHAMTRLRPPFFLGRGGRAFCEGEG